MWMKCETGSLGSQAEEVGMSHMIKNLKTWLWISDFVGNCAIEGFLIGDGGIWFSKETLDITLPYTSFQVKHGLDIVLVSQLEKLRFRQDKAAAQNQTA